MEIANRSVRHAALTAFPVRRRSNAKAIGAAQYNFLRDQTNDDGLLTGTKHTLVHCTSVLKLKMHASLPLGRRLSVGRRRPGC
jgi:hypothetical protein